MVVRLAADIWNDTPTTESTDDAAPVTAGQVYDNTQVVSVQLPDTVGPWLDIDGVEYAQNSLQFVVKPAGGVIAASDPITVAEFAQLKGGQGRIGDGTLAGPAVERDVIQANRGSVMAFGDLQFRVPSSGNSSLQMRYAAGVTTISEFTTKWSNQQGGASENAFGFNLGSAWAYFRANGALNLTQHNSYQDATFVCLGWLYRVEVIVGNSWLNNRFSFSRWRLSGVKGESGADGVNGVDGTNGIDGTNGLDGVGLPTDTTEVGTPLQSGSDRHYVMQWDGTKLVNTLAKEVWTEGTIGNSGYRKYMIDHLLGHARIAGRNVITSTGTISWNLDFALASAYVFAHDLREAQAETASMRINSRTVNSLQYTLHDSSGTGDGGSNVQFELSGDL